MSLWHFACELYPEFQQELLQWQSKGMVVNDLLFISYAQVHHCAIDRSAWKGVQQSRLRGVLQRLRQLRQPLEKTDPKRSILLKWELELERMDLSLLERCLLSEYPWEGLDAYLENISQARLAALGPLLNSMCRVGERLRQ